VCIVGGQDDSHVSSAVKESSERSDTSDDLSDTALQQDSLPNGIPAISLDSSKDVSSSL